MSARDDYPQLAKLDRTNYVGVGAAESVDVQARNALDEIDDLRAELAAARDRIDELSALLCDLLNDCTNWGVAPNDRYAEALA